MRERVLAQLTAAEDGRPTSSDFDRETRALADAVLVRDRELHWDLIANPNRLRIRTIDAVSAEIARTLPVLSGSGGQFAPVLDASPLYQEAARRTFLLLGGKDPLLTNALRTLLLHRDGSLAECERLLAEMLSRRDQWGELIPLTGDALTEQALDADILPRLERALDLAICSGLSQLARSLPPALLEELTELSAEMGHAPGYKGEPSPINLCAGLRTAPGETAEHIAHWRALIHLLTTKEGTWRSGFRSNWLYFEIAKHHAARMKEITQELSDRDDLLAVMKRVRSLPPAKYPAEQWVVAKALFRILQRALAELQLVFVERGECDFNELSLLARVALRRDAHGEDLATALGMRLQHLLVDEMQDTSTSQYELISLLTEGWDGHSQTVFLVGDPKQSIYLFRQARVERFIRTLRTERLEELPLTRLQLTANFRSQRTLVDEFNEDFAAIFPAALTTKEDVAFTRADATQPRSDAAGRVWHTRVVSKSTPAADGTASPGQADAREIRRIAAAWRDRPLPTGRTRPWSIAVLVRSRSHLTEIVSAFKQEDAADGGPIPFRAVDIELLSERQEVLDLFALTRALLHPADRVAWLAILRAPWCGLTLADLHLLAGADDPAWSELTVDELLTQRGELLSPDGCRLLEHLWTVMQAAATLRSRMTTAQWVERTWRSLGGDAWLGPGETANAKRYLQLLDELEAETGLLQLDQLGSRLKKLYAEAAILPNAVDLMTIHGAKGLEWDVVIVPALERKGQSSRSRLLTWVELDSTDADAATILLAPIQSKGGESGELNTWLNSIESGREAAELKRLFYVACTRAREELHLFGSPESTSKGAISPAAGSLLKAAWGAASQHFAAPNAAPNTALDSVLNLEILCAPAEGHSPAFNPGLTLVPGSEPGLALAASAAPEPPPQLLRLPADFRPDLRRSHIKPLSIGDAAGTSTSDPPSFTRPEGSLAARAFGNAVHAFLEVLAQRIADNATPATLLKELPQWTPRIAAALRSSGLSPAVVDRLIPNVQTALSNTLRDETGRWILANHPEAASERSLTTQHADSRTETVRLDRTFRAGAQPLSTGDDHLWIVDFKTATHTLEGRSNFLKDEKATYAPQMEAYANVLTAGKQPAATAINILLYYPAISSSIWWPFQPNQPTPPQHPSS